MILKIDMTWEDEDKIVNLLEANGFKVVDTWGDEIIQDTCPNCGESEFWSMYDKHCSHCGFSC